MLALSTFVLMATEEGALVMGAEGVFVLLPNIIIPPPFSLGFFLSPFLPIIIIMPIPFSSFFLLPFGVDTGAAVVLG